MGWDDQSKTPLLNDTQDRKKPETSRGCNDIVFLVLFVACCVGMVIISSVAFARGDPKTLIPEWSNDVDYNPAQGWFTNAVAQAKEDKDVLMISVLAAVLLGFGWIQMMKMFTTEFVYGTLIVGVVAVAGLGGYVLDMGLKQDKDGIKVVSYVIFGLDVLLLLLIIFLRKKIALTCAMIKIYLWSIPDSSVPVGPNGFPQYNERVRNLMLYQVFAFLWVVAFLSAVYQHVVAGSVAGWYFSRDVMSNRPRENAFSSLFRAVTTSSGSLAFGALVLAFVQFLNFLLELTKKSNTKNRFLVCLISGLQCLLGCIQGIVQYINKFAYIHIAMHGYSFCKAARGCFDLISRNLFSAVIMDTIAGFVLFVGKALFTALSTIITIAILDITHRQVSYVTLGLTASLSFIILHIISHVIGVSVDTVFVCYLEDLELNNGENLYISPDLHALLQEAKANHNDKDNSSTQQV